MSGFHTGDFVRISAKDIIGFKDIQKGHGGWNPLLGKKYVTLMDGVYRGSFNVEGENYMDLVGRVHRITSRGNVRVAYENGYDAKWTLNPDVLTKVDVATNDMEDLDFSSDEEYGDFVEALQKGNVNEIREMISQDGGLLKRHVKNGQTALHVAVLRQRSEVITVLLKAGMDINTLDHFGETALLVASKCGHVPIARILAMKKECDVNFQNKRGNTALCEAVLRKDLPMVSMLCELPGINFSLTNKKGFNALHLAVLQGIVKIVSCILASAGELVNVKAEDGYAPLHLAALNGLNDIVNYMMLETDPKPDPNLENHRGETALHLAVKKEQTAVISDIVRLKGNVEARDKKGNTPLRLLMKTKYHGRKIKKSESEYLWMYHFYSMLEAYHPKCGEKTKVTTAFFLLRHGAFLESKDDKGSDCKDDFFRLIYGNFYPEFEDFSNDANNVKDALPYDNLYLDLIMRCSTSRTGPYNWLQYASIARDLAQIIHQTNSQTTLLRFFPTRSVYEECIVCSGKSVENVTLLPCMHKITCEYCSARMKKCILCKELIAGRKTVDGRAIPYMPNNHEKMAWIYMEEKLKEIEETVICAICTERRKEVAFRCGHGACTRCSLQLVTCHFCRKIITEKIRLY